MANVSAYRVLHPALAKPSGYLTYTQGDVIPLSETRGWDVERLIRIGALEPIIDPDAGNEDAALMDNAPRAKAERSKA